MSGKGRSFVVTWNNPSITLKELDGRFDDTIKYAVFGLEAAPTTGTKHFQGYISFTNPRSITAVNKKYFESKAHLAVAKGTAEENRVYCTKNGDFIEYGNLPKQGARTDLPCIKELRLEEGCSVRELVRMKYETEDGEKKSVIKNLQQLKFAEALSKYTTIKERVPPKVYWFWGASGTGKTRTAWEMLGYEDTWISNPGTLKWFDRYDEHKNVIIDDFRTDLCTFDFLLRLLDRYPLQVEIKGGFVNWVPEVIIITTPYDPEETYDFMLHDMKLGENLKQLTRRITEVRKF